MQVTKSLMVFCSSSCPSQSERKGVGQEMAGSRILHITEENSKEKREKVPNVKISFGFG